MDYSTHHPKPRKYDTCKKVDCVRYEAYERWSLGDQSLRFCLQCKHASVSQYKRKAK